MPATSAGMTTRKGRGSRLSGAVSRREPDSLGTSRG
jgi:hypothetical protein